MEGGGGKEVFELWLCVFRKKKRKGYEREREERRGGGVLI